MKSLQLRFCTGLAKIKEISCTLEKKKKDFIKWVLWFEVWHFFFNTIRKGYCFRRLELSQRKTCGILNRYKGSSKVPECLMSC